MTTMTPQQFVQALGDDGLDAWLETPNPGAWPFPHGALPGGYGWIMSDEADHGLCAPGDPMPERLHLQFYQWSLQRDGGPFGEPARIFPDIDAGEAQRLIRAAAAGELNLAGDPHADGGGFTGSIRAAARALAEDNQAQILELLRTGFERARSLEEPAGASRGALLAVLEVVNGWHRQVIEALPGDPPMITVGAAADQIITAITGALHESQRST
jgi:hypothetical protein